MATTEKITSVIGETYDAVWIRCEVAPSPFSDDEFYIRILADNHELPLPFLVAKDLVEAPGLEHSAVAEGAVKVLFGESNDDGTITVTVIGEAVSVGPEIRLPESLLR